jgi:polar amino acid transport system substrate-binding protein
MRRQLRVFAVIALALSMAACMRVWTWGDQSPAALPTAKQNPQTQAAQILAPTGVLRVGVYAGSPTSLVTVRGERRGMAFELGHMLGQHLGVPVQLIEFPRVAEVVNAVHEGRVDFTFTNASPARAKLVDFTPTLVHLELGILVQQGSPLRSVQDIDQAGLRLGVSQGSSSQSALGQRLKQALIVPQASLGDARQALERGDLDAFATNKGILFELADQLPRHRVLTDAWGHEQLAIAIPQGRTQAMPWLQAWAQSLSQGGQVTAMAQRAGLRGLTP